MCGPRGRQHGGEAVSWLDGEEEEGEAFFSADALFETRGSREIKAEDAERKKETAPVVYFVQTKLESHLWKKVIEPSFVSG